MQYLKARHSWPVAEVGWSGKQRYTEYHDEALEQEGTLESEHHSVPSRRRLHRSSNWKEKEKLRESKP